MSDTIWININNGDDIDCNEEDHSIMLALTDELDILAGTLGVKPLSAFYDYTDMEYNLKEDDDQEDYEEESDIAWSNDQATWFNAEEAYGSVTAILESLEANPEVISLGDYDIDDLIWELEDAQTELEKAIEAEQTFHFCIVM